MSKCETFPLELPTELMDAVKILCESFQKDKNQYMIDGIYMKLEADLNDNLEAATKTKRKKIVEEIKKINIF
ncbi:MAG: hypothetical protein ACTSW1_10755 [Candidatus Hodarchaeales archaeon]